LSYGDSFLWVGIDRINKFNPLSGEYLEDINLPGSAAELFFDSKFWSYDESNNTIKIYYLSSVGINENNFLNSPKDFSLYQNYPNPFNPSTTISWQTSVSGWQTLKVYDALGIEVTTLIDEFKPAGSYEIEFDATNIPSGVYFYRLITAPFIESKKMILMK
jgi:hypothetical protein